LIVLQREQSVLLLHTPVT